MVDDRHLITDLLDLGQLVARDEDGLSLVGDRSDQDSHLGDARRIGAADRVVGVEHHLDVQSVVAEQAAFRRLADVLIGVA